VFLEALTTDAAFVAEVRAAVLTEELLALPSSVARLVEAVGTILTTTSSLTEAVRAIGRDLASVTAALGDLIELVRSMFD
jgi:hypothetical protein